MEQLKDKFILLDTNVLIHSSKNTEEYSSFYSALHSHNVKAVLEECVRFEFLRSVSDKKERKEYELLLSLLTGSASDPWVLPVSSETFATAKDIANLYTRDNKPKIEFGDCMIAAQMHKYAGSGLYLATENHNDFPRILFELVCTHVVDVSKRGELHTIGIYKFRIDNYKKLMEKFIS